MQRILFPLLMIAAVIAACETIPGPWRDEGPTVDEALLVLISDEARHELDDLRAERARMQDEVAVAASQVDLEERRREIASEELDVAEEEVERVQAWIDAAATDPQADDDDHERALTAARTHVDWAEAQIDYSNARIAAARAERELAERRVEAVEARFELRKALAVDGVEGPRAADVDVGAHEAALDAAGTRVHVAEIEAEAAKEKARAQRARMDEIAGRVSRGERERWRRVDDVDE